jgi:hypothetical protein
MRNVVTEHNYIGKGYLFSGNYLSFAKGSLFICSMQVKNESDRLQVYVVK